MSLKKKKVSGFRNSKKRKKTINLKRSLKRSSQKKKTDLKDEIEEHFKNNLENEFSTDKLFCESLKECSNNVLNYIGFNSFPETLKEEINSSIFNFSYLLKYSFLESIKLAISIFGIISFSVPSIENLYTKGKNISENVLNKISLVSSKIKKNFINNISKLGNINPAEILTSIKNIILKHKVLISISTVCLVLFSIQFCRVVNGGIKKFSEHFSFVEILKKNLSFFPLNTNVGQVIIEYTGMFIDNSRSIVNKIIQPINSVCQFNFFGSDNSVPNNVILQKHQTETLKYLSEKCINQHGLILYHNMGSGKTLTALSILSEHLNNRDLNIQDIIIICPTIIKSSWIVESKKINLRLNYNCIRDYEEFQDLIVVYRTIHGKNNKDLFKDKFLVFDECHHLIPILKDNDFYNYGHYIQTLNRCKTVLLLTGTPYYYSIGDDDSDIGILLNISEGHKNDFPLNNVDLKKKYINKELLKKRSESFIFNWFKPFVKKATNIAAQKLNGYYHILTLAITGSSGEKSKLANFVMSLLDNFINPIRNFILELTNYGSVAQGRDWTVEQFHELREKCRQFIRKTRYELIDNYIADTVEYLVTKLPLLILLSILFTLIFHYINRVLVWSYTGDGNIKKSLELLSLDYDKLGKDVGRYISYFKNKDSENFAERKEGKHFETPYSLFQAELCFKLYFGLLDKKYKQFITGFSREEEIVKGDILSNIQGSYTYSISIGNFSPYIDDIINKKIDFKINAKDGTISLPLSVKRIMRETCSKFTKLANYLLKNNNKRIMISSQFSEQGAYLLSSYLTARKIRHLYLNNNLANTQRVKILNLFNNNFYNIIIIDKFSSEGINLLRVSEVHLLEPIAKLVLRNQTIARAIRYKSHEGVEPLVTVHTHVGVMVINSTQKKSFIERTTGKTQNQLNKLGYIKTLDKVLHDKKILGLVPRTNNRIYDYYLSPVQILSSTGLTHKRIGADTDLAYRVTPDNLALHLLNIQTESQGKLTDSLLKENVLSSNFKIANDCISSQVDNPKKSLST